MTSHKSQNAVLDKKWELPTINGEVDTSAGDHDLWGPIERICVRFAKEVATDSNDIAGDGATTLTLLAQAMLRKRDDELSSDDIIGDGSTSLTSLVQTIAGEADRVVATREDPVAIKRGIEMGIITAVEEIRKLSAPDEARRQIAQIVAVLASEKGIKWTDSNVQGGIIPSCKAALLNSIPALDNIENDSGEANGVDIVRQALLEPLKCSLRSLGEN